MTGANPQRNAPKNAPLDGGKKPPLSCAECRRLKLKCNRVWPCHSCQKRGLADLCPDGSLATRPRHKPPPPTPQHVLQRVYELQARITELESALAALQATVSTEPHPLLRLESQPYLHKKLMRKTVLENAQEQGISVFPTAYPHVEDASAREEADPEDETEDIIDALGTLSIAPGGRSTFFGPTAVSEGLSTVQEPIPPTSVLPVDIVALAQSFPLASLSDVVKALHERIKAYLPPIDRAETLCASFFAYASFVGQPVPQDECFENIFSRLYGTRRSCSQALDTHYEEGTGPDHQWQPVPADELSLFFAVLALGTLTDLATEPFSSEAETYYQLSKALLAGENVLREPTIASVQSLFLFSYYEGMQSQGNSSRDSWIMITLASKTAHIMGLHRDHSMFGLDDREIQRRRLVFWETYSIEMIQCLALGRPWSTPPNHMDSKMPLDTSATTSSTGEVDESYYLWKYRFCEQIGTIISEHVLRVKLPSYASTLEADRKLRQFSTTFGRNLAKMGNWPDMATAAQLQMMLGTTETFMLYIHRSFFAHAVSTEPVHPEKTKYGRSVLAAYESARLIVAGMQRFVGSYCNFAARLWFLWNHLLSSSFVLGSIVARAPGCSLAGPALSQLDIVHEILKQASVYGGRAEYMLPVIARFRVKGYNARMELQAGSPANSLSPPSETAEEDDELAVIGGKTRVVLARQSSMSPPQPPPPVQQENTSTVTAAAALRLSHTPEYPHSVHETYQGQEMYIQPSDMYPVYQAENTESQAHGHAFWSQDNYTHNVPQLAENAQPRFTHPELHVRDGVDVAYSQLPQPPQQGYSAYMAETGSEVGPNLWQTLVRDLGVGAP